LTCTFAAGTAARIIVGRAANRYCCCITNGRIALANLTNRDMVLWSALRLMETAGSKDNDGTERDARRGVSNKVTAGTCRPASLMSLPH